MKPPFRADKNQQIMCPRKEYEVHVFSDCHGWALRNELCHYADTCPTYLDLLIHRIKANKPVDAKTLEKMGIDPQIVKGLKEVKVHA